jgi:hypothetical protein
MSDTAPSEIPPRDRINLSVFAVLWLGGLAWAWRGLEPIPSQAVIWIATTASFLCTVINMRGRLPLQNVVGSAVLTFGIAWALESAFQWAPAVVGHRIVLTHPHINWPWMVPLLWMGALINARGVVRLILRPAKHWNGYGFWVIGFASILAAMWMCLVDAVMTSAASLWNWQQTLSIPGFHSLPALLPIRNIAVGLIALVLGMPWLLNKKPVPEPINWHPLGIWLVSLSGLTALAFVRESRPQVVAGLVLLSVPAVLAIAGGRSRTKATAPVRPPF